ncbi:Putative Small nuclear ribonucleoprotein [Aspergillus calidoustus]|uniref:Small nuclear ribonucleoprotein G n=2 Tax=Aspergillus subgen. Nidulantes TaxID=2720870 RepID=A0A0U5CEI3_ASPCI|nr:Putative Small nuclear ribonucleoprotein [Aspergillus calidoustus]
MEKRVFCELNGNRKVIGILRGYDVFMNIVLDDAVEEKQGGEKVAIGMVVSAAELGTPILYPLVIHPFALRATNQLLFAHLQVIRGNSVVMLEALERISDK